MSEAVMLKLVSGEEIFASLIKIDAERVTFSQPMKIFKQYNDTPRGMAIQLNFEPFLDYGCVLEHTFRHEHIMSCEPLVPRLIELYNEMKDSVKPILDDRPNQEAQVIPGNITLH